MNIEYKFPEVHMSTLDLMHLPTVTGLNLCVFNLITGNSIIGVVLDENHDSFLVALPSRLLANKDKRLIEPHMPTKYCRFMKGAIVSIIPCYGEFEVYYIQYLLSEGKEQYPELVSGDLEDKLKTRFNKIKETLVPPDPEPEPETNADSIQLPVGSSGRYKH